MHVGAFGVVVGVALRTSNTGRVESYTVRGDDGSEGSRQFFKAEWLSESPCSSLSTGRIVGAFVMVLEFRHVIKTINDMHLGMIRSNDIHLEFFLPGRLAE